MSNNRSARYHPFQVSLHWLVVILIFAAFLLGKSMSGLPNDPAKIPLLALHMGLGLTTLIVRDRPSPHRSFSSAPACLRHNR
jgi:cytochrome b561